MAGKGLGCVETQAFNLRVESLGLVCRCSVYPAS
jgi:hypothetical protein